MRLPASLVIGAHDIAIKLVPGKQLKGDNGEWRPQELSILVAKEIPSGLKAEVLMHEALHGIWEYTGLPVADEEMIITRLAPAVIALCRQNPGLASVLFPKGR